MSRIEKVVLWVNLLYLVATGNRVGVAKVKFLHELGIELIDCTETKQHEVMITNGIIKTKRKLTFSIQRCFRIPHKIPKSRFWRVFAGFHFVKLNSWCDVIKKKICVVNTYMIGHPSDSFFSVLSKENNDKIPNGCHKTTHRLWWVGTWIVVIHVVINGSPDASV